jgi:ABC-type branched-subunit amino acid transport system substrate-binding protein
MSRFTRLGPAALVVFLLIVVVVVLQNYQSLKFLAPRPVVLVIGNTGDPESFAWQANDGLAHVAVQCRLSGSFRLLRLPGPTQGDSLALQKRILRALARWPVRAILSCQNSPDVPPLLAICDRLQIPVLLLVATNTALLSRAPGLVLRLPPSDTAQASALAEDILPTDTVALFYENNNYGRGLASALATNLRSRGVTLLQFTVGSDAEISPLLLYLGPYHCTCVIYAGYYYRVTDILAKLTALHFAGKVLLTDGCYSQDLRTLDSPPYTLALSFPVDPYPTDPDSCQGFRSYGHDAGLLLYYALSDPDAPLAAPAFITQLTNLVAMQPPPVAQLTTCQLINKYQFDSRGENSLARCRVWYLHRSQ